MYLGPFALSACAESETEGERSAAESRLARDATYGTLVMMEGMWTDFLTHMDAFDRTEAERIVRRFLSGLFPDSF